MPTFQLRKLRLKEIKIFIENLRTITIFVFMAKSHSATPGSAFNHFFSEQNSTYPENDFVMTAICNIGAHLCIYMDNGSAEEFSLHATT